jgi:proline iminopeptidase
MPTAVCAGRAVVASCLGLVALACGGGSAPQASPSPEAAPVAQFANGSFTEDVGGRSVHYEVRGQGPVLMVVTNSWGTTLAPLRRMFQPLEEKLTLVYFDPRGMGGSGPAERPEDRGMAAVREDFDALRRHLKLERVHAIGWSNGAMNLVLLAEQKPDTLSSAIFVHGVASFGPEEMKHAAEEHPELFERYGAFLAKVSQQGLADEQKTALQRELWLNEYFPALFADPVKGRSEIARLFAGAPLSWPHAEQTNKETGQAFDVRDKLAGIPVRSLVIAGAHDMSPPAHVKQLADGLPNARFAVMERSGHFSPVEQPEAFRRAVLEFLGEQPPRP